MKTKTVLILAAGRGTRMGGHAIDKNKSLLPLYNRPILSNIIDQFSKDSEIVVAVGYKSEQVRDFFKSVRPDVRVRFVDVSPFEGVGSGSGYSAYCARIEIREPFYLVCCDTVFSHLPNDEGNWVGVKSVAAEESSNYLNIEVIDGRAVKIYNKTRAKALNHRAFVGLAHIRDWQIFFKAFENNISARKGAKSPNRELELDVGLQALIDQGEFHAHEIPSWIDVGRRELYERALTSLAAKS